MSAKEVRFSDDARSKMFAGVNVLANAVKVLNTQKIVSISNPFDG